MLVDLVLTQSQINHPLLRDGEEFSPAAFNRALKRAPKFNIQNVCDYYFNNDIDGWDDWQRGFPCCMPPFNQMWMETEWPANHERDSRYPFRWGFFFQRCQFPADASWQEVLGSPAEPETMSVVFATPIFQVVAGSSISCAAEIIFAIDKQGEIWREPKALPRLEFKHLYENGDFYAALGAILRPMLLAVSFLHCKNVEKVEHRPDRIVAARPPTSAERKGKTTAVEYYTLNIQPMRKILHAEGRIGEVGLKKALHICRGHFAQYSEDKPLFGKVSGRFWIPAHVRGSKDAGEIRKDYRITAPATQE